MSNQAGTKPRRNERHAQAHTENVATDHGLHSSPDAEPKGISDREKESCAEWQAARAHIDCYTMCHQKLVSENELTNHRLSWNFAIQGFLFTAYAVCLQTISYFKNKIADIAMSPAADKSLETPLREAVTRMGHAISLMRVAGASVSFCIFIGAVAAHIAIFAIHAKYRTEHPQVYKRPKSWLLWHGDHFPGLTGGGSRIASILGAVPVLIPLIFVIVWWKLGDLG